MADEISIIQALILGAVQGIAEWLPISSEGITMFLMINAFGKNPSDAISYAIFLHFGTMLAAILKFKGDFLHILASFVRKNRRENSRENSMLSIILIATLFTGLTAVPLYIAIKYGSVVVSGKVFSLLIGALLILTGFILSAPERRERSERSEVKGESGVGESGGSSESGGSGAYRRAEELSHFESALLGAAQGCAILPGISRSGTTIAFLLLRKIRQEDALKISFIISVPAVLGAVFIDLIGNVQDFNLFTGISMLISSFIFGYATIDVLLRFASIVKFSKFCISIGLIAIIITILTM
ncbi:MAG: undecaprenyl-diphosphate phosphatase [Candidatus Methanospirare jalkutatii]|nr:undecaprenyl-diphosphate phosphatase [Candidatus Methanospirare jalkutatii]